MGFGAYQEIQPYLCIE